MAETVASYSVPEHHVKMYTANVQSALMKQGGLLQGYVTVGSYRGEKVQVVNFLGPVEFIERNVPYASIAWDRPSLDHDLRNSASDPHPNARGHAMYAENALRALDALKLLPEGLRK